MQLSDPRALAIILDWVGSLLMLGTMWGWLYGKLSPRIRFKAAETARRLNALERYIEIRVQAADTGNFPVLTRVIEHAKQLGFEHITSRMEGFRLLRRDRITHRRLLKRGLLSPEDAQRWKQWESDRSEIASLGRLYVWKKLSFCGQMIVVKAVGSLTESLFQGRLAILLFILGFLFWNMAKILNLRMLK